MGKFKYNIEKYPFTEDVKSLYGISNLEDIHNEWPGAQTYEVLDDVETDQLTVYHKHFYDNVGTAFYLTYKAFIEEVVAPEFFPGVPILYQAVPTFRVHQPSNLAVAEFHRDKDYSHSEHEVNFYVPLTKASGNNTIWAESTEGGGDFEPLEAEVGEAWVWMGSRLLHGNKLNDSGVSRVSLDFRILPKKDYEDTGLTSITNKTKMIIGDYWEELC